MQPSLEPAATPAEQRTGHEQGSDPLVAAESACRAGRRPPWEREAIFYIDGLSCRRCARHAEETLRSIDGVCKAAVGFVSEVGQVVYDLRRTSEHVIVAAMARVGFRLSPAASLPPSARPWLDHARLALTVACFANVTALGAADGAGSDRLDIALAKLVLTSFVLAAGGLPMARRVLAMARRKVFGKDCLLLAATAVAFALGVLNAAILVPGFPSSLGFFVSLSAGGRAAGIDGCEVATALVTFSLTGHYLYARIRQRAMRSMLARAHHAAQRARRIEPDGTEHYVPRAALSRGDCVSILEGEAAPADLLLSCPARISERDGEAIAGSIDKLAGEILTEGSVVLSASAQGRVLRQSANDLCAAADAEVQRAVQRVDSSSARDGAAADWPRLAAYTLTVGAWAFAAFALVVHSLLADTPFSPTACSSAVAVLIAASPSAFVLGAPAARAIALLCARSAGIVVKSAPALETLGRVDVACFGKTGTVTCAEVRVTAVRWLIAEPDPAILPAILSLEQNSSHPVGRAIAAYLRQAGVTPMAQQADGGSDPAEQVVTEFVDGPAGVRGRVGDDWIEVNGQTQWDDGAALDARRGCGIAWFGHSGQTVGYFELDDPLRPAAAQALRGLWERGLRCRIVTGDRQETTLAVAHSLGVRGFGGLTQEQKAEHVRALQRAGSRVLFVGDGLHDRPNLVGADVAIAVAPEALPAAVDAPIVLTGTTLEALPHLLDIARSLRARLRQIYGIAALYNAIVIPLAATGVVAPLQAAALMLLETLVVVASAARLLRLPGRSAAPSAHAGPSGQPATVAALDMRRDAS